jgi:REP element-mobilizing transposase RayT
MCTQDHINHFGKIVTKKMVLNKFESRFKWQRSFYDRIIRNEKELRNIRKYIQQNPIKWELEKDIVNLDEFEFCLI